MTIIRIADMRNVGICKDAQFWFADQGLDWRDFKKNGINSELLRATGDNLSAIDRLEISALERERNGKL